MTYPRFLIPLVFAYALAASAAFAEVFRVDVAQGVDLGGCGSAASPCASIQQAVNLATNGDRILVADGVYFYTAAADPCSSADTGVVCIVNKELTILGGFDGGDWTISNPIANPTIIDGNDSRRGVLVTRSFPGAPAASLVLEGFTIRNGRAVGGLGGPDGASAHGGGLKAALSNLIVRDVVFSGNRAVGAATASGAGGGGVGGGLFSATVPELLSTVRLERVRFEGNQAIGGTGPERGGLGYGGGMFVNLATLTLADIEVVGNAATAAGSTGSGVAGFLRADALGGGLGIAGGVTATIERLSAVDNAATGGAASAASGFGGGAFGGGVYIEASTVTMTDSSLRGNSAVGGDAATAGLGAGGGLMSFDGTLVLERSSLIENHAEGGDGATRKGSAGGGGAYLERANDPAVEVTLVNSVVADNFVQLGSGGGTVGGGGGGLFLLGNEATLRHLTLAGNGLSESPLVGQALVVVNRGAAVSQAVIEHTIVSDHQSVANVAAVQVQPQAFADFERPMFADNARDTNEGFGPQGTITGLDTALHAADAGYVSPGPPDFDYHITLSSPAVDEATGSTVTFDLDATRRSAPRDIGADEVCRAADDDLVLENDTLTGSATFEACDSITVRDYTVAGSGELVLQAGRRVVFEDGFSVLGGGSLRVVGTLP